MIFLFVEKKYCRIFGMGFIIALFLINSIVLHAKENPAKPRVIATTDGEIDDRCSMIRFLLYNNEWEIEGIIHGSSRFHSKGDGKKIKPRRWNDMVWLDKQIDLYEKIYPNLIKHDKGFHTPDELRKLVYIGNIESKGEMTKVTPGSTRIVEILLENNPRPVYLQAWGGNNTIARALKTIQDEHPKAMERVSKKAIMYIILDQDETFKDYIMPNWPKLQVLRSQKQYRAIGYKWLKYNPQPVKKYYEKPWMQKYILKGHGELCSSYETTRKKKKGTKGMKGRFLSEGDSPSFMHQIDVGLRSLEHPGYGGWGAAASSLTKNAAMQCGQPPKTMETCSSRYGAGQFTSRTTGPHAPTGVLKIIKRLTILLWRK